MNDPDGWFVYRNIRMPSWLRFMRVISKIQRSKQVCDCFKGNCIPFCWVGCVIVELKLIEYLTENSLSEGFEIYDFDMQLVIRPSLSKYRDDKTFSAKF